MFEVYYAQVCNKGKYFLLLVIKVNITVLLLVIKVNITVLLLVIKVNITVLLLANLFIYYFEAEFTS